MRLSAWLAALAVCFGASQAEAAGLQLVDIPANAEGPAIKGAIWYPCAEAATPISFGKITIQGAMACRISGANLPLIVISHGRGGSFLGHHDTAEQLADAGYVVAALNHPGDTSSDMSRSRDLAAFVERPAAVKRLIDFMLSTAPVAQAIDPKRIGFFGFSRGGYTGLVLIGANPDWALATRLCQQLNEPVCEQVRAKQHPETLAHDPRIKAAVIADPFAMFFAAESIAPIAIPVQLWASERGGDGVAPESVAAIDKNLRSAHDYHVVAKSGHFAFLAPCPAVLVAELPMLCRDAADFDRAAFHQKLNDDVLSFFRKHL